MTGGTAGKVRIWDYGTAKLFAEGSIHTKPVVWCGFTPDSKQVISGSMDSMTIIWNFFS